MTDGSADHYTKLTNYVLNSQTIAEDPVAEVHDTGRHCVTSECEASQMANMLQRLVLNAIIPQCKGKRQYMLTFQVSIYCLLALYCSTDV